MQADGRAESVLVLSPEVEVTWALDHFRCGPSRMRNGHRDGGRNRACRARWVAAARVWSRIWTGVRFLPSTVRQRIC